MKKNSNFLCWNSIFEKKYFQKLKENGKTLPREEMMNLQVKTWRTAFEDNLDEHWKQSKQNKQTQS